MLRLQQRDYQILDLYTRHRFLTSHDIAAWVSASGYSDQWTRKRLTELTREGYLDIPPIQEELSIEYARKRLGKPPITYALGDKGAKTLKANGARLKSSKWREKNLRLGSPHRFKHTLLVDQLLLRFALECQLQGTVRFIPPEEVVGRGETSMNLTAEVTRRDLSWLKRPRELSVSPDAIFGLHFLEADKKAYFFLEADRATEPLSRKQNIVDSSILKKLATYNAFEQDERRLPQSVLGIGNFRVLFVTTGRPSRMQGMVVENSKLEKTHANTFLFTTLESLTENNPLTFPWINGRGEHVQLMH